MAVIGPDGTPTESGSQILLALKSGLSLPEEIARNTSLALFVVKSGLRDMERARLVKRSGEHFELDSKGDELLR